MANSGEHEPVGEVPQQKIQVTVPLSETTWLENIREVSGQPMPDGTGKILTYTLANGHRYVVPLRGNALRLTQQAVSSLVVPGGVSQNGRES